MIHMVVEVLLGNVVFIAGCGRQFLGGLTCHVQRDYAPETYQMRKESEVKQFQSVASVIPSWWLSHFLSNSSSMSGVA